MKKIILPIALLAIVLSFFSCGSTKNIPYFQNADSLDLSASKGLYDARIMPKDLLTVTVNTTDPKAASPFNLSLTSGSSSSMKGEYTASPSEYLVDNNGDIVFPVIGSIHVAGLTKTECEQLIREKILPYMASSENPVVTVRMASYKISVIGEVGNPGVFTVSTEKISVLEALANAGDLTIYGKRENVMLIREDATGEKSIHRLNLNDANIIKSPYYYLQQNDVLYIEPNKVAQRNATVSQGTTFWISSVSALTSLTSLIVTLTR